MDRVFSIDVAGRWGIFIIIALSVVIWNLFSIGFLHARLERYLAQINYPNIRPRTLRTLWRRRSHRHLMGGTWLANRAQHTVIAVALCLVFMLFCRAVDSEYALEFGRGGALLVVFGLISILLGYNESERIREDWNLIAQRASTKAKQTILEEAARPREFAQLRSTWISVVISVIGTILWAYGDQIMACGFFRWAGITDATQVICLK